MNDRREFFVALSAALLAGGAQPAAGKVTDAVRAADGEEAIEHPFGVQHIYFQGPTDMLQAFEGGSLKLKAGMEPHPPHSHPDEEIMLVTEGQGEISVEGRITAVGPGSMMYTAGNSLHGVKNTGQEPLLFYYFKWIKKES